MGHDSKESGQKVSLTHLSWAVCSILSGSCPTRFTRTSRCLRGLNSKILLPENRPTVKIVAILVGGSGLRRDEHESPALITLFPEARDPGHGSLTSFCFQPLTVHPFFYAPEFLGLSSFGSANLHNEFMVQEKSV